jgi:phosphoglucomutase
MCVPCLTGRGVCIYVITGDACGSVSDIVGAHWQQYGRHYAVRHDYENMDATKAKALMTAVR